MATSVLDEAVRRCLWTRRGQNSLVECVKVGVRCHDGRLCFYKHRDRKYNILPKIIQTITSIACQCISRPRIQLLVVFVVRSRIGHEVGVSVAFIRGWGHRVTTERVLNACGASAGRGDWLPVCYLGSLLYLKPPATAIECWPLSITTI